MIDVATLCWITGTHASRPDEFGAAEQFAAVTPHVQIAAGRVATGVCLRHTVNAPLRALADGQVLDLGGRRMRWLTTPHVPFWEAGVWIDDRTGMLFCGDLFTAAGDGPPATTSDIVGPALDFECRMRHFTISPALAPTLRRLAALDPEVLALMHGPAFNGDAADALRAMAAHYANDQATGRKERV